MKTQEKIYEYCMHCESEVELEWDFKVQKCPICGSYIVPCSLCPLLEKGECNGKCALAEYANELEVQDANQLMTEKQIEIADKLESLVHPRFSISTLETELSKIFGETIKLEESSDNDLSDWNFIFSSNNEDYGGVFDIYVLKHKNKSQLDNSTMYVTEVGYEFEI